MNKMSKFIAISVSVTLALPIFTGCGKKKAEENVSVNNSAEQNNGPDWKKDTSPISVTWFVAEDWYNKKWDPKNCLFDKMVTDETGVSINFQTGNNEKLSALIASGEISDVVTSEYPIPQTKMIQQSGMVYPMDELVSKYAPNFKIPKSMVDWHKQEDGHLYGFVNFFYAPEKLKENESLPTHTEIKARKDIMDKLGIKPESFNTKKGTIEALKKVKDAKLKFNGFDVVPAYFDHEQLIQMFGARREDEKGNYVDRMYEPESLEAFKFMNQLYREDLLGKDLYTLNIEQRKEKIAQGSVFAYTNHLSDGGKENVLYNIDNKAYSVQVTPIKGDAGKKFYADPSPMAGWTSTMISKKAKKPDRIIRLFEYLYSSDEMHLNANFGPKGAVWNYDDKGHIKYTEQFLKDKNADPAKAQLKYGYDTLSWLIDWTPIMRAWPEPTNVAEKASLESDNAFAKYSYPDLVFSAINPPGGTDESAIDTKIKDYRKKQVAKIVMAGSEGDAEKLFNEMKDQEKKFGYDKLYKWQNEQFKAAKKKLGIEFAWPANKK